jgi:hypothetical protein
VRPVALTKDQNQFVLRAVETSYPAVVLDPHAHVQELVIVLLARGNQFSRTSPVHAQVVDRIVDTVLSQQSQTVVQEGEELGFAHFPRGHQKFAMPDGSVSCGMPVNLHVERRIREDDRRPSLIQLACNQLIACAARLVLIKRSLRRPYFIHFTVPPHRGRSAGLFAEIP